MFANLLASIEGEIKRTNQQIQNSPQDVMLHTKKLKLKELAMQYVKLEQEFKELAKLNGVY